MAARKQLWHPEVTRLKIKTSQLINRLQKHALSSDLKLSNTQVRAIEILLRKTTPDLMQSQNVNVTEHRFAEVPETATREEWDLYLASRSGAPSPDPKLN